jgi:hypothetical protein
METFTPGWEKWDPGQQIDKDLLQTKTKLYFKQTKK